MSLRTEQSDVGVLFAMQSERTPGQRAKSKIPRSGAISFMAQESRRGGNNEEQWIPRVNRGLN